MTCLTISHSVGGEMRGHATIDNKYIKYGMLDPGDAGCELLCCAGWHDFCFYLIKASDHATRNDTLLTNMTSTANVTS